MFYERRIGSFPVLERELQHLDSDAGIRALGTFEDRPCFIFVTRFVGMYTAMVYERGGTKKTPTVGKRILAKEFGSRGEVATFLKAIMPRKVEAYLY